MQLYTVVISLSAVVLSSGCFSIPNYTYAKEEIAQKRMLASGNRKSMELYSQGIPAQNAIKVIPLGGDNGVNGAILAVDIGAMDVIAEYPWRTIGAALLD